MDKKYYMFPEQFLEDSGVKEELNKATGGNYEVIPESDDYLDDKQIIPYKGLTEKDKEEVEKGLFYSGTVIETELDEETVYSVIKKGMMTL